MRIKSTFGFTSALIAAAITSGCGGSPTLGTASNPRARAVDAFQTPTSVTATIDGTVMTGVSGFGSVSGYQVFNNGSRTAMFTDASTAATLATQSPIFTLNSFYTVIGYAGASGPAIMVLSDSNQVSSGQAAIRVTKAGVGGATVVDVYVTTPGADIVSASPTFAGVTLGDTSQTYRVMASGTYEVRETAAGAKNIILDQQFTLGGGTATTLLDVGTSTFLRLTDK